MKTDLYLRLHRLAKKVRFLAIEIPSNKMLIADTYGKIHTIEQYRLNHPFGTRNFGKYAGAKGVYKLAYMWNKLVRRMERALIQRAQKIEYSVPRPSLLSSDSLYTAEQIDRDPHPQIEGRDPATHPQDCHPTQGPHPTD